MIFGYCSIFWNVARFDFRTSGKTCLNHGRHIKTHLASGATLEFSTVFLFGISFFVLSSVCTRHHCQCSDVVPEISGNSKVPTRGFALLPRPHLRRIGTGWILRCSAALPRGNGHILTKAQGAAQANPDTRCELIDFPDSIPYHSNRGRALWYRVGRPQRSLLKYVCKFRQR